MKLGIKGIQMRYEFKFNRFSKSIQRNGKTPLYNFLDWIS